MAKKSPTIPTTGTEVPAPVREQTRAQFPPRVNVIAGLGGGFGFGGLGGGNYQAPRSDYKLYRRMNRYPTLAIARAVAEAPVKSVEWSYEEDGAPPGAKDIIEACLKPILPLILKDFARSMEFGNRSSEIVWGSFENFADYSGVRWLPRKIKSLIPENTEVRVEKETGVFAGLKQGDVELDPIESLHMVHDQEGDNYYGVSRHENCRSVFEDAMNAQVRAGNYTKRMAGGIPVVRFPIGESEDSSGSKRSNYDIAIGIIARLEKAMGVAFPVQFSDNVIELVSAGAKISDALSWSIDLLEPKTSHGTDFDTIQKINDRMLLRGWLVPERTVTEGSHGTKAEAGEHFDVFLMTSEEFIDDCARTLNWHLINKILRLNWGPDAENTVYAVPGPLVDEQKYFLRGVFDKLLANPLTVDMILELLPIATVMDQAGVPIDEDARARFESITPEQRQQEEIEREAERTAQQMKQSGIAPLSVN